MRFLIPIGIVLSVVVFSFVWQYLWMINISGYPPWLAGLVIVSSIVIAVIVLILRWWSKVDGSAVEKYHEWRKRDL